MDDKTVPQLLDLPFACDSEHDEVIYWHTVSDGKAQGVRLFRESSLIEFDMWLPVRFYTWAQSKRLSERDKELASVKAYEQIQKAKRVKDGEVSVHVVIDGHPQGVRVHLQLSVYSYEQPCWCDESGRVW